MMRVLISIFLLFFNLVVAAQETSDEKAVRSTIETFFDGFHTRDSVVMKSVLNEKVVVQTIGKAKTGETALIIEDIHEVLKGIVSIPLETGFKEVLHAFEIKTDGPMAHAWTPYSFYTNDTLSHCGVNSFQLIKDNGKWKIIYLIDTRRKENCDHKKMK